MNVVAIFGGRVLRPGCARASRNFSTFSYRELVDVSPISAQLVAPTHGEHLTGPAQRLFKQLSSFEDASEMFSLIKVLTNAKHVQPEHYHLVLERLSEQKKFEELNELKSLLAQSDIPVSVETYNSLFGSLFEQGKAESAKQATNLWKEMEMKKIAPNDVTFELYVSGLAQQGGAYSEQAVELLMAMKNPTSELCYRVFLPLVEHSEVAAAENLVEFMKKTQSADVRLYNLLLRLYLQQNDATKINELLEQMKGNNVQRDSKTWALLIEAFKKDHSASQALVKELESVKQDSTILSALSSYYLEQSNPELAEATLQKIIDAGDKPQDFAYLDLLAHYSEKGDIKRAQRVFDSLRERNVTLTVDHYHTLGKGYIEYGAFDRWDALLSELEQSGYQRTLETYHLQMKRIMYDTSRSIGDAEPLLDAMKKENIHPTLETWTLLMDGYCVIGDMETAHKTLDSMKADGITPKAETYLGLIAGYHQHGNIKDAAPLIQHFSALEAKEFVKQNESKAIQSKE